MSFWTKNLECLKNRFPHAVELVEKAEPRNRAAYQRKDVVVFEQRDNGKQRRITSAYNPTAEAQRQISRCVQSESDYIIVAGEAGFYHIEALLAAKHEQTKVILLSESPENMAVIFNHRDVSKVLNDPDFFVYVSKERERLKAQLAEVLGDDHYLLPIIESFEHPLEFELQEDFLLWFQKTLIAVFETIVFNRNTKAAMQTPWSVNLLHNIPHILQAPSVIHMKDAWLNKPLIIVGAGPSLEKNMATLRELKGRAFILCVDAAYRALERNDIVPDAVISIDPSDLCARFFADLNYDHVPLIAQFYSHRSILDNHHGLKVMSRNAVLHDDWWNRVAGEVSDHVSISTGGSVSTSAFSLARVMGANPVIMVGQDLSYPGGKAYVSGTNSATKTTADITRKLIEVEGIDGEPVLTTTDYKFYLRWFEREAMKADRRYIDATEGGAKKAGYEIMTLAEAREQFMERELEPGDVLRNLQQATNEYDERLQKLLKNLIKNRSELRAVIRYTDAVLNYLEELESAETLDERSHIQELMEKAQANLRELKLALSLIDGQSLVFIAKDVALNQAISKNTDATEEEKFILQIRQTQSLFFDLQTQARETLSILKDGMNRVYETLEVNRHEYSESVS